MCLPSQCSTFSCRLRISLSAANTSLHALRMWVFRNPPRKISFELTAGWDLGSIRLRSLNHGGPGEGMNQRRRLEKARRWCIVQSAWCVKSMLIELEGHWASPISRICRVACDWVDTAKPPCFMFCDVLLGCCTARSQVRCDAILTLHSLHPCQFHPLELCPGFSRSAFSRLRNTSRKAQVHAFILPLVRNPRHPSSNMREHEDLLAG
jgi:hypothetical protein